MPDVKFYTVVHVQTIEDETDHYPFVHIFRTKQQAVQAIETAAEQEFEHIVDPNDGDEHRFPGVEANEDGTEFRMKDEPCLGVESVWIVTEVAIKS